MQSTEDRSEKRISTSGHSKWCNSRILVAVFTISFVAVALFGVPYDTAHGHGTGSEIFPPVTLDNGQQVALEVSVAQPKISSSSSSSSDDQIKKQDDNGNSQQRISISLVDFDSKVTLRDVTYVIRSEHGSTFLFERQFEADNGFLVFEFVSDAVNSNNKDTFDITVEELQKGGFLSFLGLENRVIRVSGIGLADGGLYKFNIQVITAGDYSKPLVTPLVYNSGISIPQTTNHQIQDPNFGEQYINVITYYDEIYNFGYDPTSRTITYSMPFDWSESNIEQTPVVHEEIVIPYTFGDLLASGFEIYINGVRLSDDVINIDDFFGDGRIVHFIIPQQEVYRVYTETQSMKSNATYSLRMNDLYSMYDESNLDLLDTMFFLIRPDRDDLHMSSITENSQFRILVSWEPTSLTLGEDTNIEFGITDIFLKDMLVATDYTFSMTAPDGQTIYEQTGVSSDSEEAYTKATFVLPSDVSGGVAHLNFERLAGNDLARTSIPVVIDRLMPLYPSVLPDWIKTSAGWWASGQIDDDTFVRALEYLIGNGIIVVSSVHSDSDTDISIPLWVRDSAGWWASGQIDDDTFVRALEYLIGNRVIRI